MKFNTKVIHYYNCHLRWWSFEINVCYRN